MSKGGRKIVPEEILGMTVRGLKRNVCLAVLIFNLENIIHKQVLISL